jgi:nucleoside-diphosphate-sugar epimerase
LSLDSGQNHHCRAEIASASKTHIFGWEPRTRLREGLELTYRWIYDEMTRGGVSVW